MTPGASLRANRTFQNRNDYQGRFQPEALDVHHEFITATLNYDGNASVNCQELKDVYEAWLDSEYGRSSNPVDRNFLYEEIEVMSNGIAQWRTRPNHHFTGIEIRDDD